MKTAYYTSDDVLSGRVAVKINTNDELKRFYDFLGIGHDDVVELSEGGQNDNRNSVKYFSDNIKIPAVLFSYVNSEGHRMLVGTDEERFNRIVAELKESDKKGLPFPEVVEFAEIENNRLAGSITLDIVDSKDQFGSKLNVWTYDPSGIKDPVGYASSAFMLFVLNMCYRRGIVFTDYIEAFMKSLEREKTEDLKKIIAAGTAYTCNGQGVKVEETAFDDVYDKFKEFADNTQKDRQNDSDEEEVPSAMLN